MIGGFCADHDWIGSRGSKTISIDATDLPQNALHNLNPAVEKGGRGGLIGQTKGGMNTRRHTVRDTSGRPIRFFITAGLVSDYTGAMALLNNLPDG